MSSSRKNEVLLAKYNKTWDNVSNTIKSSIWKWTYLQWKVLKTEIKSYKRKISTNCHDNKKPKGSLCICVSVILIGSVFRTGKNYSREIFLEECKIYC